MTDVHLHPIPWALDRTLRYAPIKAASRAAHDQALLERSAAFALLHDLTAATILAAARRAALRQGPLA